MTEKDPAGARRDLFGVSVGAEALLVPVRYFQKEKENHDDE